MKSFTSIIDEASSKYAHGVTSPDFNGWHPENISYGPNHMAYHQCAKAAFEAGVQWAMDQVLDRIRELKK